MKRLLFTVMVLAGAPLLGSACSAEPSRTTEMAPVVTQSPSEAETTTNAPPSTSKTHGLATPCDPHSGFPTHKDECLDATPETGWLTAADGTLSLTPFRTFRNDAEGQAYARDHGEEYPFPNDYLDSPTGTSHRLEITRGTVCTGIIRVGYEEPLRDHVVTCGELAVAAERMRVPVAVWFSGSRVVQASELYRP